MRPGFGLPLVALLLCVAGCVTSPVDDVALHPSRVILEDLDHDSLALLVQERPLVLQGYHGLEPGSDDWVRAARRNALAVDYYRTRESRYYPSLRRAQMPSADGWPGGLPRRCLALSGGGLRSAAYAMGTLDALHASHWLDNVDVVASSSGGSYVNYWLTMALAEGRTRDEMFAGASSPSLFGVRKGAELLTTTFWVTPAAVTAAEWLLFLPSLLTYSPIIPGPIDRKLNLRDEFQPYHGTSFYAGILHRMFAPETDTRPWILPALARKLAAVEAPVPVFVATAREGALEACSEDSPKGLLEVRALDVADTVFEFTPWRVGSDGIGYAPAPQVLQTRHAVAASGAAPDDPNASRCRYTGAAEYRLGLVNNRYRAAAEFAPTTQAKIERKKGVFLTLLDAAFSDNLAVLPLVRRMCQEILVIDAEHDPSLGFESYVYLQQHLRRMGLELAVDGIDALVSRHNVDCSAGNSACLCRDDFCLVVPRERCLQHGPGADCTRPYRLENPLFPGVIRAIPFPGEPAARQEYPAIEIDVTYLKLSLDETRLARYPAHVRDRFLQQAALRSDGAPICTGKGLDEVCSFPHESTYDQDFGDGQFEAYWELGRCNAERFLGPGTPETTCRDEPWPAIPARAGRDSAHTEAGPGD